MERMQRSLFVRGFLFFRTMLYLILGVILGVLISLMIIVSEIYFVSEHVKLQVKKGMKKTRMGPRASVIVLDERKEVLGEKIQRNEVEGRGTTLNEMYDSR